MKMLKVFQIGMRNFKKMILIFRLLNLLNKFCLMSLLAKKISFSLYEKMKKFCTAMNRKIIMIIIKFKVNRALQKMANTKNKKLNLILCNLKYQKEVNSFKQWKSKLKKALMKSYLLHFKIIFKIMKTNLT